MMNIYYTNQNNEHSLYVDESTRQTVVRLPIEISEGEAWYFAKSDVSKFVISALLKEGEA